MLYFIAILCLQSCSKSVMDEYPMTRFDNPIVRHFDQYKYEISNDGECWYAFAPSRFIIKKFVILSDVSADTSYYKIPEPYNKRKYWLDIYRLDECIVETFEDYHAKYRIEVSDWTSAHFWKWRDNREFYSWFEWLGDTIVQSFIWMKDRHSYLRGKVENFNFPPIHLEIPLEKCYEDGKVYVIQSPDDDYYIIVPFHYWRDIDMINSKPIPILDTSLTMRPIGVRVCGSEVYELDINPTGEEYYIDLTLSDGNNATYDGVIVRSN